MTGEQIGKIWVKLFLAGHKTITVEEIREAVDYAEES